MKNAKKSLRWDLELRICVIHWIFFYTCNPVMLCLDEYLFLWYLPTYQIWTLWVFVRQWQSLKVNLENIAKNCFLWYGYLRLHHWLIRFYSLKSLLINLYAQSNFPIKNLKMFLKFNHHIMQVPIPVPT